MERSTPQQVTRRRVSVQHMLANAVSALVAGQRIEFSGRGSRQMQRKAEMLAANIKWSSYKTHYNGPIWTGKPRQSSFRSESGRITARY